MTYTMEELHNIAAAMPEILKEDGGVPGGGLGQESICPKVKEGHDENSEGLPQDSQIGERRGTNDVSSWDDTEVQQDFDD